MKAKLPFIISGLLISSIAFAQDSSANSDSKVIFKSQPQVHSKVTPATKSHSNKGQVHYRPTRLGSSSPLYDTYKKNDYGAGSVTTNPNKSAGTVENPDNPAIPPNKSTNRATEIRRDTRLGSSSPLYDTYRKNDYGAGSVTTNPHKSGGSGYGLPAPATDSVRAAIDSSRNQ